MIRYIVNNKKFAIASRLYSSMSGKKGVVLGVTPDQNDENKNQLTPFAEKFNESTNGELLKMLNLGGPLKKGKHRLFWGLGDHTAVAVVGMDLKTTNQLECLDEGKESIRAAASIGVKALLKEKITNIEVEPLHDAESAAIGAVLGSYKFQDYKTEDKKTPTPELSLVDKSECIKDWERGVSIAESQNFIRTLMDTPANLLTPTIFSKKVSKELTNLGVNVEVHDQEWAKNLGMNSFLSVGRGSDEPSVFMELKYAGAASSEPYACLVGKGVTFDSGGISIKPSAGMDAMRADMGGAACVVGTIRALAKLKAKVNVIGLIPLCENMPNGRANKPGDVVVAMNKKSICINNTDAEGRLILADALCYSEKFKPKYIVDIATLTGAIQMALGTCVAGVFTNNEALWKNAENASHTTGDRLWRMPLFAEYKQQITDKDGYDLNNISSGKGGGACTAAAFLREFVPKDTPWMHIDMAGVMGSGSGQVYTSGSGMSGRPMRTLLELVLNSVHFDSK